MKRKILFIVPNMCAGGAERVILTLLKHLPREQFDLNLALVEKAGPYLNELPNDVVVYDLGAGRVRYSVLKIVRLINKNRPDIVFSTLGHLNVALVISKIFWKHLASLIIREGTIASIQNSVIANGHLWSCLYKRCYPKADKIICQSKAMADDLISKYKIPQSKICTIYNPIDLDYIDSLMEEEPPFFTTEGPNIVAIGRLATEKRFDKLIIALPSLLSKYPGAHLWIIGEGPLRDKLKYLSAQLNIEERVHLVGFQHNPYTWLANADLFVLSSAYEGLPNVLLEAMACGCPVVSLEHPGGTREIFEITGQLDRYVKELTWEEKWFKKPSPEVRRKLEITFGLEKVVGQYRDVFCGLIMDDEMK